MESVVIIVFVTLITVLLFFTGIYFYYVRGGKQKIDAFITEHKRLVPKFGSSNGSSSSGSSSTSSIRDRIQRPKMPSMPNWTPPTMPKMPLKMPQVRNFKTQIQTFLALELILTIKSFSVQPYILLLVFVYFIYDKHHSILL